MENQAPQINILVPLYNEEEVFDRLVKRLQALIQKSSLRIKVLLVDDGSLDNTPTLMRKIALADDRFSAIFLSRNFGHQLALTAGLNYVDATEGVLIIDGDLQDPPELLEDFYPYLKKGFEVVYAVRKKRKEIFFKKWAYKLFYLLLKRISRFDIPLDAGDFSLISRRVVNDMNRMKEESRYLRGMRHWVGYKQIGVEYERAERSEGETKYSLRKLMGLAFDGIFNFSEVPIKFISMLGVLTILVSLSYLVYNLFKKVFFGYVPEGFTGLIFVITLFGGVQLVSIGVLGEYIIRIFFQVKNRPLFIVKNFISNGVEQDVKSV